MKKVLVVDFDARSRLEVPSTWAEITTAAGMQEAVALTKTKTYDIIVAAARIPGGSCVELFSTLHRSGSKSRYAVMRNGPFDKDRIPFGHGLILISHPFNIDDLIPYLNNTSDQEISTTPVKKPKLLVVDSDHLYVETLMPHLQKYKCDVATSLKEAVALSLGATPTYDAILCEVFLHDSLNGLAVSTLVESSTAPIVCCSSDPQHRAESLQNGAQAYIDKRDLVGIAGTIDLAIEQYQSNRLLREMVLTDARTGLIDWVSFRAEVAKSISNAEIFGTRFAITILDLDKFKSVNDTYGHDTGDVLICEVADRIKFATSFINGIPSRFAGDEFGVILPNIKSPNDAKAKVDYILSKINKPVDLGIAEWTPSCSGGIALYPDHGVSVKALLESADHAAYAAKAQGRNRSTLCTQEIVDAIIQNREVSKTLTTSIQTMAGFGLVYQPIINLKTGKYSLEALLRWSPSCGRRITPDIFIPLLERNGLICQVGKWTLAHALKDYSELSKSEPDLDKININISVVQLADSHLPDFLQMLVKSYNILPSKIGLELTESEKLVTDTVAHKAVQELHEQGFYWTLDDFGTGYASVKYVENFPFQSIKIDKSIVTQSKVPAYVKGITSFCHELNLSVVAEGVETEDHYKEMVRSQVDKIQGYFIAKPMAIHEVSAWRKQFLSSSPKADDQEITLKDS